MQLAGSLRRITSIGYAVIGVSKDGEASHRKFIEKQSLPFSLIADTECKLNEAFGVWREKKMAGRTYMGTVRTTFIIDENGVITDIIEKVDTKNHASQILKINKNISLWKNNKKLPANECRFRLRN